MHGGLVDDEGLDYDELRHGPTGRSDCSPFDSKRSIFQNRIDRSSLRKDINWGNPDNNYDLLCNVPIL